MDRKMRKDSNDNTLFVTELCNNKCIMCCQPPKMENDIDFHFKRNVKIIKEAPEDLLEIGITGGEPMLLGERLYSLLEIVRQKWPNVTIHILSNGRLFENPEIVEKLIKATGDNLYIGVPFHSDFGPDHDLISGAKGAYAQTLRGLYNLAEANVEIELRIVINKLNWMRLPQIADFIFKNLTFVNSIAFMAMELCGDALKNYDSIWIEPIQYADKLEDSVLSLVQRGMDPVIFNIPLCLLPETLLPFAVRSISEWKVTYLPICDRCTHKSDCCGLFSTSFIPFDGLNPLNS